MNAIMESAAPIVRFESVRKSYDGQNLVVKDLNLEVVRGEFLTLLGPSGSGKTTTLMMLAGFETPTEGRILVGDRNVTRLPPHKRGIGVVFQNYALFPHMTIAQNIGYPLRVRGVASGEIERRVAEALAVVKLGDFGSRRPAQLSGGQQQRAAVARALVFRPEIVLLDEPLGALDKQLRERMQHELMQLHEELNVTMVYVTHDQTEALTMSDRIAVFNDGLIQQLASPSELYGNPANAFVAEFIGENNRMTGRVEEIGAGRATIRLGDDAVVSAVAIDDLKKGDDAILSLRPECVVIDPDAALENRMNVPVEKAIYLGDTTKLVLKVGGEAEFSVKVPNANRGAPASGAGRIDVGWRSEDCRAYRHG